MRKPKINCPRCGSEQRFPLRTEDLGHGVKREFIRCNMCRMERSINYTTETLQQLRRKRAMCKRMMNHEEDLNGCPTPNTFALMNRIAQDIKEESAYIARTVLEINANVPSA